MTRLSSTEFELFLVQSWMIWNQRNVVAHGGKVKDPRWLNKRAREFLDEFHQSREQLHTPTSHFGASVRAWQPPLPPVLKLNFDAAIFEDLNCSGVGAIIRNDKGEAMASMSAIGCLSEPTAPGMADFHRTKRRVHELMRRLDRESRDTMQGSP